MINNFHQPSSFDLMISSHSLNTSLQPSNLAFDNLSETSGKVGSFHSESNQKSFKKVCRKIWQPSWVLFSSTEKNHDDSHDLSLCSQCGRLIRPFDKGTDSQLVYESKDDLGFKHLIHKECIKYETGFTIFTNNCEVQSFEGKTEEKGVILGGNEYAANLTISNLLGTVNLFKGMKKLVEKQDSTLIWQINQTTSEQNLFEPNLICIPIGQFRVQLKLHSLKGQNEQQLLLNIDLSQNQEGHFLASKVFQHLKFEAQFVVVRKQQEKMKLLNKMNFKYRYQTNEGQSLIFLNKISLTMLESLSETSSEGQKDQVKTNNPDSPLIYKTKEIQLQKIVKTQFGSKEYQKKVKLMEKVEITALIQELSESFSALIQNQFGNYFVQTLFSHCDYNQRVEILNLIKPCIVELVRTQEGTFTLQYFINYLTPEEVQLLYENIENEIIALSFNEYATHFVRKLIKEMPLALIKKSYEIFKHYFVDLAENKKGICVLKEILRNLIGNQEEINTLRKKFLHFSVQNFSKLIDNQYGNYIIQEIFEKVPSSETSSLTAKIIENFEVLAQKKYASLVLSKCLKKYWKKQESTIGMLKQIIRETTIFALQKNKEGSKVLWEMKTYPDLSCKLEKVEKKGQNSPYLKRENKGYYSGKVGSSYNSFSSAVEHIKQKNYIK